MIDLGNNLTDRIQLMQGINTHKSKERNWDFKNIIDLADCFKYMQCSLNNKKNRSSWLSFVPFFVCSLNRTAQLLYTWKKKICKCIYTYIHLKATIWRIGMFPKKITLRLSAVIAQSQCNLRVWQYKLLSTSCWKLYLICFSSHGDNRIFVKCVRSLLSSNFIWRHIVHCVHALQICSCSFRSLTKISWKKKTANCHFWQTFLGENLL